MSRPETKARIPHMLMDTDFYEKPENLEAIDRFGDAAPSCIQRICFKLMNEEGARMKKSQVLSMWRSTTNKQDVWSEMVEYFIGCGWLFEDGEYLSSERVRQERERVVHKRSILSANAKQKHSKSAANAEQQPSKSSDTDTVTGSDPDLGSKDLDPKKPEPVAFVIDDHSAIDLKAMQAATLVRTARLEFTHNDLAALVMNHYHGDASRLVIDVRAATDNRIKNGADRLDSERSSAFIRSWIKNGRQFAKGGPAAAVKKSNLDVLNDFAITEVLK